MRIVALADSLAMPREEDGERVTWDETWPYRLEARLRTRARTESHGVEVINCGMRARTADLILGQELLEHVAWKRPDVVVLQVGVVDCAPRIISQREKRVLNLPGFPPRLRTWLIEMRSANRAALTRRDRLGKVYVPPERFEANVEALATNLANLPWSVRLLIVPIVIDWERAEQKSPGYSDNVELYNGIFRAVCARRQPERADVIALPILDRNTGPVSRYFLRDGYHLSAEGNRVVAQAVGDRLESPTTAPTLQASPRTVH